ncbi:MAG: SRPBCC family protein [Chloroflexota bacterium]
MVSPATSMTEDFVVGASVQATIAASPEALWAWIADPTRHPEMAGSGEPQSIQVVDRQPEGVGRRFESRQRIFGLVRYVTRSEVTKFEPDRRFRFQVDGGPVWDFELEPVDGGTLVTHRHRFAPPTQGVMGLIKPIQRRRARQNADGMARTLLNLARLVGAPPPANVRVSYDAPILN